MPNLRWLWLGLLTAGGCHSPKPSPETRFVLLDPARTGVAFANTLRPTFADNILEYNYFYNGGGVAVADFDRDGRPDLYFSGNQVSSRLYLNRGDFHFEDVTDRAGVGTTGWCTGVAAADVNGDGWTDLYVCHAGLKHTPNQLFINLGKQPGGGVKFSEKAREFGLDYAGFCTQAAFFDYDRDGDLDCYLLTHFHDKTNPNFPRPKTPDAHGPTADRLYQNCGIPSADCGLTQTLNSQNLQSDLTNPHFQDVTERAGVTAEGLGLGVVVSDFNADGWPDLYVTNDFAGDDVLYLNRRDGTFADATADALGHTSRFAMGCDAADVSGDGLPDVVTLDMMPPDNARQKLMATALSNDVFSLSLRNGYRAQYARNCLQVNNGDAPPGGTPSFSEIGQLAGISQTDWSWSALLADFDNDGRRDLFVTNGIPRDITNADFVAYRSEEVSAGNFDYNALKKKLLAKVEALPPVETPNFMFRNRGDWTFADESAAWGLAQRGCSNGAAYADLDGDGDLDLVTNNLNAPASVLENRSERFDTAHFLRLRLDGRGVGASIRVAAGGTTQGSEAFAQRGFQSSVEELLHFGLGKTTTVDTLEVVWPSGKGQRLTRLRADTTLTLREADARLEAAPGGRPAPVPLLTDVTDQTGLTFTHVENDFEDFNLEPLLPHRFSRQGPCLAVGDVNGDGLDDVFVGGPAKIAGSLFLQKPNGTFTRKQMPDPGFEDTGAALFDADGDGDLDLYVVSGGNEYNPLTAAYQDRLYRNDGRGNFTRDPAALPPEFASGSCVVPGDFDRDGDLDLFVGGRVVPTRYPLPAESFLLRNDGHGVFENVTEAICPALKTAGLVTCARWADFDNDGWPDLLLAGEWMPLTFFRNEKGIFNAQFRAADRSILNSQGWWNALATADFDGDGDVDLVAGNLGLNTRLTASARQPLRAYAGDFDQNGTTEAILTHWVQGKEVPYLGRDALAAQLPLVKKRFSTHTAFSTAGIAELLSEERAAALTLRATELRSVFVENLGGGRFRPRPLPVQAQVAPIQSLLVADFNGDGRPDVLAAGNSYDFEYSTGRADAGGLCLLVNDGSKSRFRCLSKRETGPVLHDDVRAIAPIRIRGQAALLVGCNSGKLRCLRVNSPTNRHPMP
jgi:hypothetical protein